MEALEQQALELVKALNEAPNVAWTEIYGVKDVDGVKHIIKFNLTQRAFSGKQALDDLIETIKYAEEKYNMRPYVPKLTPSLPVAAQSVVNPDEEPFPFVEKVYQKPEPTYEPIKAGGENVFNIVKIVVTPKADGKSTVEFFEQGMKWKAISTTMEPERLATSLGHIAEFTPNHFKAAAEYQITCKVYWRESEKLSASGKPYKNIVRIEK